MLARLLVLFLVPVVIIATPGVGNAANFNDWHRVSVVIDAGPLPDAVLPSCNFPARYSESGSGVVVGEGECRVVVGGTLGKAGNDFTIDFNGERAGEEAEYVEHGAWRTEYNSTCVMNGELVPVFGSGQCRFTGPSDADTGSWQANGYNSDGSSGEEYGGSGFSYGIIYAGSTRSFGSPWGPGTLVQVCDGIGDTNGPTSDGDGYDCAGKRVLGWLYYPNPGETPELWPPVEGGGGAGAGEACSASYSGVLGSHPDDGLLSNAGTIPPGGGTFASGLGGKCHVTEVCVTLQNDGWIADAEATGCMVSEWGASWETPSPDPADDVDEPAPLVPVGDAPPPAPEDEPSFWKRVADLLWWMLRGIGNIVSEIAKLPGAILDGIKALFVPTSFGWEGFVTETKADWNSGNSGDWQALTESVFDDIGGGQVAAASVEEGGSFSVMEADSGTGTGGGTYAGSCSGPGIEMPSVFDGAMDGTYYPFQACEGTAVTLADWSTKISYVLISVAGLMKMVQLVVASMGLASHGRIYSSFDWNSPASGRF